MPETETTLAVWPGEKLLLKLSACRDRSAEFLPVFPKSDMKKPKPIRPGAKLPAAAAFSAEYWIRTIISPDWVPDDLSERLLAVQAEDPASSRIACRWEDQEGNSVQVIQSVCSICVVFRPATADPDAQRTQQPGQQLFGEVLRREAKTPWPHWKEIAPANSRQKVFVRDSQMRLGRDDLLWHESCVWYADREAVAAYFPKRNGPAARFPRLGDPWF